MPKSRWIVSFLTPRQLLSTFVCDWILMSWPIFFCWARSPLGLRYPLREAGLLLFFAPAAFAPGPALAVGVAVADRALFVFLPPPVWVDFSFGLEHAAAITTTMAN